MKSNISIALFADHLESYSDTFKLLSEEYFTLRAASLIFGLALILRRKVPEKSALYVLGLSFPLHQWCRRKDNWYVIWKGVMSNQHVSCCSSSTCWRIPRMYLEFWRLRSLSWILFLERRPKQGSLSAPAALPFSVFLNTRAISTNGDAAYVYNEGHRKNEQDFTVMQI